MWNKTRYLWNMKSNTHIFGSKNLIKLMRRAGKSSGSKESKMATTKPEVTVNRIADKFATEFQRLHQYFKGPTILFDQTISAKSKIAATKPEVSVILSPFLDKSIFQMGLMTNRYDRISSVKYKMAAAKPEVSLFRYMLAMSFLRLYPYFRDQSTSL